MIDQLSNLAAAVSRNVGMSRRGLFRWLGNAALLLAGGSGVYFATRWALAQGDFLPRPFAVVLLVPLRPRVG
jgi:hypothetical protein